MRDNPFIVTIDAASMRRLKIALEKAFGPGWVAGIVCDAGHRRVK